MSQTFNSTDFGQLSPGFTPSAVNGGVLAADLAYIAYRIAGILPEPGRGYSASEGSDALKVLNSIINSMQAERLMVYAYLRNVFDIIPNQQDYRVGNVAPYDWGPIPRPEELTLAGYIFTNTNPNVENPMRILSYQEWAALSPKDLPSPIEYMLYYRPSVPNGIISLWPVPTDPTVKVALYTWENVQQVATLGTAMVFPPGYRELFEYGMAIKLAGMFPRRARLDPNAQNQYYAARQRVMGANEPGLKMQTEAACGSVKGASGLYNILSNTYVGGLGNSGS